MVGDYTWAQTAFEAQSTLKQADLPICNPWPVTGVWVGPRPNPKMIWKAGATPMLVDHVEPITTLPGPSDADALCIVCLHTVTIQSWPRAAHSTEFKFHNSRMIWPRSTILVLPRGAVAILATWQCLQEVVSDAGSKVECHIQFVKERFDEVTRSQGWHLMP